MGENPDWMDWTGARVALHLPDSNTRHRARVAFEYGWQPQNPEEIRTDNRTGIELLGSGRWAADSTRSKIAVRSKRIFF